MNELTMDRLKENLESLKMKNTLEILDNYLVGGQHTVEGYDCHIFADVLRRHGVLVSGIGDEAVFLYPAQVDFVHDVLPAQRV